jgi:hypothetical protein
MERDEVGGERRVMRRRRMVKGEGEIQLFIVPVERMRHTLSFEEGDMAVRGAIPEDMNVGSIGGSIRVKIWSDAVEDEGLMFVYSGSKALILTLMVTKSFIWPYGEIERSSSCNRHPKIWPLFLLFQ